MIQVDGIHPVEPFKFRSKAGDRCLKPTTALLLNLISTHILMSFPLGAITGRFL